MKFSIGKKITSLRIEKGYTQKELAQLCNVSSAAISKWENELSYPDIATLPILARIFHISIDELLNFEQNLTPSDVNKHITELLTYMQDDTFENAMKFCKTLVYTYPNSELLKLKIAGSFLQVTILLYQKPNSEQSIAQFQDYAKQLCEDVTHSSDLTMKQSACILMASYFMDEDPQAALNLLQSIPKLHSTISMESSLYIHMKEFDKAEKLLQTQLYTDCSDIIQLLLSLIHIAMQTKDHKKAKVLLKKFEQVDNVLQLSSPFVHQGVYFYARLSDRENTLRLLKTYLQQLSDKNNFEAYQQTLIQNPWFSKVELKENPYPQEQLKEGLRQLLETDKDFDFLREDEEFQQILQTL